MAWGKALEGGLLAKFLLKQIIMSEVGTRPKRGKPCPSVMVLFGKKQCTHAGMPLSNTVKCMWPKGACPYTPPWQLFSACLHERDAAMSMYWNGVRSPFRVPFGIAGHVCQWEKIDDHLAGCTTCGKVHRCDTDQCEEILVGEPGFKVCARTHALTSSSSVAVNSEITRPLR